MKKRKNKKIIMLFFVVLILILMVTGITYAWFIWTSDKTNIESSTGCFNINYNGSFTESKLMMSSSYENGISATIDVSVNDSCDIKNGVGTIYLNTNSFSSNEVSLIEQGALKFVVFENGTKVNEGVIKNIGDTIILAEANLDINEKNYEVYLWLDGNIADNTYANAIFDGSLYMEVVQAH